MAGRLAVVGAGLMGAGIAQVAAYAGWDVTMTDVSDAALKRGTDGIAFSLGKLVDKGRADAEQAAAARERIVTTTDLESAADADLVVEAVFEDLAIKHDVFGRLDRICKDDAVLATNTSALPITKVATATGRPENVVGTHFFSPVPLMPLCELVRGYRTSDDTLERARAFATEVGKQCVVVNRDVAGFVTTRLIVALAMEAARLVETGVASAEDVDTACRLGFGHAMGPLRTIDLTGVDILVKAAQNIYDDTKDTKFAAPESLLRMIAAGDLGQKSGQGFYRYDS